MDDFKADVKKWMKDNKITRKRFADMCFVSLNTANNWLAKAKIPEAKVALIQSIIGSSENNVTSKDEGRVRWKPYAVMVSDEDYELIKEAAALEGITVEEFSAQMLVRDAIERISKKQ